MDFDAISLYPQGQRGVDYSNIDELEDEINRLRRREEELDRREAALVRREQELDRREANLNDDLSDQTNPLVTQLLEEEEEVREGPQNVEIHIDPIADRVDIDNGYLESRQVMGTMVYELDENNALVVKESIDQEAAGFDADGGLPLFLMVRMRSELHRDKFRFYGMRYSRENLDFLINTVMDPSYSWQYYHDEGVQGIDSDIPYYLNSAEREDNVQDWFKVTHIGLYHPDADIENLPDKGIRQMLDNAVLRKLYDLIPRDAFVRYEVDEDGVPTVRRGSKRTRIGRFMPYKLNKELLMKMDCPAAVTWLIICKRTELLEELQIPWFSKENLAENDEGLLQKNSVFEEPCFIHAIREQVTRLTSPETMRKIENLPQILGKGVKPTIFKTIQNKLGLNIAFVVYRVASFIGTNRYRVSYDRYPKKTSAKPSENWPEVKLMFWENHWMTYKTICYNGREDTCFLRLLEDSKRSGIIVPYNGYEFAHQYDNLAYDSMLYFDDKLFIQSTPHITTFEDNNFDKASYKERKFMHDIYFADFEADVSDEFHKPYLIVYKGYKVTIQNDEMHYSPLGSKSFWGPDCAINFLKSLSVQYKDKDTSKKNPACRIYFYNLRYDFSFILEHLSDVHRVLKANRLYSATGKFSAFGFQTYFDFWDALPLFQCSLKNATAAYLTAEQKKTIKKELFPYKLYNAEFFRRHPDDYCYINEFLSGFSEEESLQVLAENRMQEFLNPENKDRINYRQYAIFYCSQDVECLANIMINFANLLFGNRIEGINGTPPFKLVLWKYRTASSIGYDYFQRTVLFKKEGKEYIPRFDWAVPKCALRALIQKTIRGGRVMTRDNHPHHFVSPRSDVYLVDYDGVSLYPSAMSLLWICDGAPTFIKWKPYDRDPIMGYSDTYYGSNEIMHQYYYENEWDQEWFVDHFCRPEDDEMTRPFRDAVIHLTSLQTCTRLHFPCLCIKDPKTKLNNYRNFEMIYDGTPLVKYTTVDTWITLIDAFNLIDFQNAMFTFDAAIVWTGQRRFDIRASIRDLFDFRLHNKSHPIQQVAKLMMNSIFGKSILKVTDKEKKLVDKIRYRRDKETKHWNKVDAWGEFFKANMYRINKFEDLGSKVEAEIFKRDLSSSLNIFGTDVLAMARRIIMRVMVLAEEMEREHPEMSPGLFYTDTDSMHIRNDLLEIVEQEYIRRYGTPIKGTDLTQFHIDFDTPKNFKPGEKVVGARESYFIMKKVYCDELFGDQGSIGYHWRMKGVQNDLVKPEHYKQIYEGKSVVFDLLDGHTSFFYDHGKVGTRQTMTREIMTQETREKRKAEAKEKNKTNKKSKI